MWRVFQNEKEDVKEKHGGAEPEIKMLYHGTSSTNPSIIYHGEEGFNINFSNDGLWGRAIYFATMSSYSNNYSYSTPE